MLYALLFLPALLAIAWVATRPRQPQVLAEAVAEPAPAVVSGDPDPLAALDTLLAELERATVELDAADALDERSVADLEALAERLERVGEALQPAFAHGDDVEAHLDAA